MFTSPNEAVLLLQEHHLPNGAGLKFEHGAQTEDFRIREPLAQKASKRVRRTATGTDDVLKVRLQGPASANLVLVDRRQNRFKTPCWPGRSESPFEIAIQCLHP